MADSEEAILLRRRARRRLVGAIALVVFAVIVLPIVFDKEPRPISQDIVIQIPSQNSGKFNTRLVPSSPEAAKAEPDVPKRADSIPLPPASAVEGPNGVAGKTDKDPGEAKTAAVSKAQEAKGAASDQRQQEAKSAEGKAADKKAAEAKVSTPRTTDTKIVESSTIVSKAAESKPVEAKPAVSRNADTKSTQKAKGESKDGARVAEKPVSDVDSSRAQALLQGDSYVVPLEIGRAHV